MAKYIKHYYVDDEGGSFCCELAEPRYKRHPWKEYAGLDVKVWLTDSEGVDSMLAVLPDSTTVADVTHECGKKAIQVLTQAEYTSVADPYFEAQTLNGEAMDAEKEGDTDTAATKRAAADAKHAEALAAFHAL